MNGKSVWVMAALTSLLWACHAPAEEGSRAAASIWSEAPAAATPAAPDLNAQIKKLEQAVADLEKLLGSPRGLRARQPFERRLSDLESRLDKIDKRLNDLETRLRKLETRR